MSNFKDPWPPLRNVNSPPPPSSPSNSLFLANSPTQLPTNHPTSPNPSPNSNAHTQPHPITNGTDSTQPHPITYGTDSTQPHPTTNGTDSTQPQPTAQVCPNPSIQPSTPLSYAQKTVHQPVMDQSCGLVIQHSDFPHIDYVKALVCTTIPPKDILMIHKIKNKTRIFLRLPSQVTYICRFNSISINNQWVKIRPLIIPFKKIFIQGAKPWLSNECIEHVLKMNKIPITYVQYNKMGYNDKRFAHLLSETRYTFLDSQVEFEEDELPQQLQFVIDDTTHHIFLSFQKNSTTTSKKNLAQDKTLLNTEEAAAHSSALSSDSFPQVAGDLLSPVDNPVLNNTVEPPCPSADRSHEESILTQNDTVLIHSEGEETCIPVPNACSSTDRGAAPIPPSEILVVNNVVEIPPCSVNSNISSRNHVGGDVESSINLKPCKDGTQTLSVSHLPPISPLKACDGISSSDSDGGYSTMKNRRKGRSKTRRSSRLAEKGISQNSTKNLVVTIHKET
ncbi:hypothetical protein M8J77_004887 [Diaphorina citri]|nr:hypothetical protein M8J77_004887 [Diaphorina citri]